MIKCNYSNSSDRMCLRSGKSFPRLFPFNCKSGNNLQRNLLTRRKQKVSQTSYIIGEKRTRKQVALRRRRRRRRSSDTIDKIQSEDLIREILLRLSWSTINCYKTVCKRWLGLVSEPEFTAEYLKRNTFLLGFSYAKTQRPAERKTKSAILAKAKFIPLAPARNCCPEYSKLLQQNVETSRAQKFYSQCLTKVPKDRLLEARDLNLCCCCGLILRLQVRDPSLIFSLHNPVSGDSVFLPSPPVRYEHCSILFASYGLVVDFSSSHTPHLMAVEVIRYDFHSCLQVNTFSSKTRSWQSKEYNIEPFHNIYGMLSGQGINMNGVIYWLTSMSGVVAYDTHSESFCFGLLDIPGDQLGDECFCRSLPYYQIIEPYSNIFVATCMCRFLGQSQNCLCYIRFMGHFEISMWTVDSGGWSHGKRFILHGLPASLAYGRILSIDPQDCNLLYIRHGRNIFSYHLEFHQVREIHTINLKRDSGKNTLSITPIIAYEAPKLPTWLPLQSCFDSLFGSSLCYKDSCWDDECAKFMIHPDAHVHAISGSTTQSGDAIDKNQPPLLKSLSDDFHRRGSEKFEQEVEFVSISKEVVYDDVFQDRWGGEMRRDWKE